MKTEHEDEGMRPQTQRAMRTCSWVVLRWTQAVGEPWNSHSPDSTPQRICPLSRFTVPSGQLSYLPPHHSPIPCPPRSGSSWELLGGPRLYDFVFFSSLNPLSSLERDPRTRLLGRARTLSLLFLLACRLELTVDLQAHESAGALFRGLPIPLTLLPTCQRPLQANDQPWSLKPSDPVLLKRAPLSAPCCSCCSGLLHRGAQCLTLDLVSCCRL